MTMTCTSLKNATLQNQLNEQANCANSTEYQQVSYRIQNTIIKKIPTKDSLTKISLIRTSTSQIT